jgi:hypothetical protein
MVKAFLFNELIHHRIQGFRGISAEGILDEGPRILIDINFGQVCRRLSDNSLRDGCVSALSFLPKSVVGFTRLLSLTG